MVSFSSGEKGNERKAQTGAAVTELEKWRTCHQGVYSVDIYPSATIERTFLTLFTVELKSETERDSIGDRDIACIPKA